MSAPVPSALRYQQDSRSLLLRYDDAEFRLSAEFLRVHSPSAEVQGHGGEGGELPRHKENVAITAITPVGNYAVKIHFSDGHASGLYSWDYLHTLCLQQAVLWQTYQEKLAASPDPASGEGLVRFMPARPRPH